MALIMRGMFGCNKHRCGMQRRMQGAPDPAPKPEAGEPGVHEETPTTALDPDVGQAALATRLTTGESLAEASESRLLVLVFLRHFGCTFTRQLLRGLEEIHHAARCHGADLVLVHMLRSGEETRYLAGHGEVARIADPRCELYRAFGLAKGGWRELLGLHVLWLGLVSIFKGCGVGHLAGDGRQMPGVFLFQRGRIIAAQRAQSAADLPDLARLFQSLPHAAAGTTRAAPEVP